MILFFFFTLINIITNIQHTVLTYIITNIQQQINRINWCPEVILRFQTDKLFMENFSREFSNGIRWFGCEIFKQKQIFRVFGLKFDVFFCLFSKIFNLFGPPKEIFRVFGSDGSLPNLLDSENFHLKKYLYKIMFKISSISFLPKDGFHW